MAADWKSRFPEPDWVSPCGNAILYNRDCMEVLSLIPEGAVDAVVTDPPYGIGEASGKNKTRGLLAAPKDYGNDAWDDTTADEAVIRAVGIATNSIIFGGNFYHLPPSSCWLVWDKQNNGDFADAELAWTNLRKAVRLIQWRWNGMIRKGNEERYHPTQKPVGVMQWCLGFVPNAATILDPFAGSGTTGVAALRLGRKFIGIEIEPKYFEIAKQRIANEHERFSLFNAAKETQSELFTEE